METSDFDYEIPRHLIAQEPKEPRDHSRLLVLHKDTGKVEFHWFHCLTDFLNEGDTLVFNDSRVIPARIKATQALGEEVTILLLRPVDYLVELVSAGNWEVLVEAGKVEVGEELVFSPTLRGKVFSLGEKVGKRDEVLGIITLEGNLEGSGEIPIPPYIHSYKGDAERYQTVYSKILGSAAAPTAGLHFTPGLLDKLREKGIELCFVTLHVSIDTFMPVYEDSPQEHKIHKEWIELDEDASRILEGTRGRVICVGTTSTRVLEQVSRNMEGKFNPWRGWADIFILPGYEFHIDGMVTNFHYPRSTNIMMVASFVGWDKLKAAYEEAFEEEYRLYSFGDSMLII